MLWQNYEEVYQQEEELNNQLNVFAVNFSAAYGGSNDVKTQIGYSIDKGEHQRATHTKSIEIT